MTNYINQYKQFSKFKKFVVIMAFLQLGFFTIYELTLHSSLLEAVQIVVVCYAMDIVMPYYNITCLNQTVFYLSEEDCHAMVIK